MRVAVLTLAGALALVLAGTWVPTGESAMEAFSRSDRGGSTESILFNAHREPGRGVAVTVEAPGLAPADIATARVVFKRGDEAVAGVPLTPQSQGRKATFKAVAPDTGEWTSALVLLEKHDRALLVKEFAGGEVSAGLRAPILPSLPAPMEPVDRGVAAAKLVVREVLLLPGPVERFLFGE